MSMQRELKKINWLLDLLTVCFVVVCMIAVFALQRDASNPCQEEFNLPVKTQVKKVGRSIPHKPDRPDMVILICGE
jgi:hypothetical protein